MKNKIIINLILFSSLTLLALTIHYFSFDEDFITGGIDGLCLVLAKFFKIPPTTNYSYNYVLYVCLNLLALVVCFQQEKIAIFVKTTIIVLVLLVQLYLLGILEKQINYLDHKQMMTYLQNCSLSSLFKTYLSFPPQTIKFLYATFFSGMFFGISLGFMRRYGYTSGGMDIYQKFLKDKSRLSFTQILFLTDGIIILSAFIYDCYHDLVVYHIHWHIIDRVLLPCFSLVIISK